MWNGKERGNFRLLPGSRTDSRGTSFAGDDGAVAC
jgi:hypothetical protein